MIAYGNVLFCRCVKTPLLVLKSRHLNPRRFADILYNVIFPLSLGVITYVISMKIVLPGLVRNHLADGLWAYAFASYLLIIWDREIRIGWLILMVLSVLGFELMQSFDEIPGTGDGWDVLTYLLFFAICYSTNRFFRFYFTYTNLNP